MATRSLVTVRNLEAGDLPQARELSRQQKWPHRTSDWAMLLAHGSGVAAEVDGKIVGTAMCWRYGEDWATVGMVIVSPRCQGRGIGGALMEAILERLDGRNVMLNSTTEGLPLYRKFGFEEIGAVLQHQGRLQSVPLPELRRKARVRPLGASERDLVAELDCRASGMDRRFLMAALLDEAKGVILDVDNEAVGFALLRRFGRGYAIGPTVAPGIVGAKMLISHWLGAKIGSFCRLDVTSDSGLSRWLDDLGLPCVGRVTKMVRGSAPAAASGARLFSLISQALG